MPAYACSTQDAAKDVSVGETDIEARTTEFLGEAGRICRICHGGPEDGRLISPCLCKGSMKYIHLDCLQRWRAVGGKSHYFRCSTCCYEYRVQRVAWARWLTKAWVTHVLTLLAMLVLIFISGYLGKLLSMVFA